MDQTLPRTSKEVRFLTGGPHPSGVFHQLALISDLPLRARGREGSPGQADGSAKGARAHTHAQSRARTHTHANNRARTHTHTRTNTLKRETKFHLLKPWGEEKAFQGTRASTIRGRAEIRGSSPQPFQDRSRGGPRKPQVVHPLVPPRTLSPKASSSARQANRGPGGSP